MSRPVSRPTSGKLSRIAPIAALALGLGALGGCKLPTFGAYRGATTQGQAEFKLWSGMMIAGVVVMVIVLALIIWACFAYRRRNDEMPKQFHANIPIEIVYTILPLVIVFVIFGYTVVTENTVDALVTHPAATIRVTGFQWGWKFTYVNSQKRPIAQVVTSGLPQVLAGNPTDTNLYPQFELPVGETTRIVLNSNDVVHTFYIPEFNFGRYAEPGYANNFDFTPVHTGVFPGRCSQYCGLYHSEMLFSVKVVSPADFQAWLVAHAPTSPVSLSAARS
jgi:cytochrome c oxidase subunit 2